MTRRELILAKLSDAVVDFVYYDRKEDEELPCGAIQDALARGEITIDDMTTHFRTELAEVAKG